MTDTNDPSERASSDAVEREAPSNSGLLGSSFVVSIGTMLSRVLGLVRDVVLANLLGAAPNADAFFVAFKIPNFLRRLFAEGAFSQAFVPVLTETREQGSHEAVRHLVDRVAGVLGGSLFVLTALAMVMAPWVALIFAPGFSRDVAKLALTADLIVWTFPYLLLISLTGFCGAILNTYGRFAVPAYTPVLLNLSLITAAVVWAPTMPEPALGLAMGVTLAGVVQLLFQLPSLRALKLTPRPVWDTKDEGVRKILMLMVPALFGVSVSQINLLFDTVLASLLPDGSVAWLYYSDRLTELPLGVFAIAIATVILPTLSALNTRAEPEEFSQTLAWAMRNVLLIAVPATVALWLLAEPILATLFQYGAFTDRDVEMAAASLRAYTVGLGGFMLIKVLAPGYYARQDMKTPVKIGIIAMVSNMVLNVLFVFPLMWYFEMGHVGLALATSVSAWINAGLLYLGLRRGGISLTGVFEAKFVARLVVAVSMMGIAVSMMSPAVSLWLTADLSWRVGQMTLLVFVGMASFAMVLAVLGFKLNEVRGPRAAP
ncbi:MAG: murein biosynthesis integral membrane protein MurJ [Halieaceae bacterium]|nr:murein biosynthesis integral membrane protein MurJ [Halieaceae bacterium]RPG90942.1 MAG: murein biosynthesis integral membrane protein MurJ [Cellvibrionales bacterium TMED157]